MNNHPSKDPYLVLGLSHDASPSEIRRVYQKLALKYHPDRHNNKSSSDNNDGVDGNENSREERAVDYEEKMAEINEAYGILKDEEQKRHYDHLYKIGGLGGGEETTHRAGGGVTERTESRRRSRYRQRTHSYGRNYAANDPFFHPSPYTVRSPSEPQWPSSGSGSGGGFSFSYTSMEYVAGTGDRKFTRKTTRFQNGKKYTHMETTTIRADGTADYDESSHYEENATFLGHFVKSMLGISSRSSSQQPQSTKDNDGSDKARPERKSSKLPWFSNISAQVKKCVGCSG